MLFVLMPLKMIQNLKPMSTKIIPISVTAPGLLGLNLQKAATDLGIEWAVQLDNCVFDSSGRITSRKGWAPVTTTPISGTPYIEQLYRYVDSSGDQILISAAANKLYSSIAPFYDTLTDLTGTLTPTANNWKFQNFNNKIVGFQSNHTPIVWDGIATSFSAIVPATGGTVPNGNDVLSAFGRLWAIDSTGTKVRYSALLDETTWNDATTPLDSGIIDLQSSKGWVHGRDNIVAITSFNNFLIIFSNRSILVYRGIETPNSTLALDDVIYGVGCIARDSIQDVGNDLLFLSETGVRSLQRTLIQKTLPLGDISQNVVDYLMLQAKEGNRTNIRSIYYPKDGFYALSIPNVNLVFVFDLRKLLAGGIARTTIWNAITPRSWTWIDEILYLGEAGVVATHSGYSDNGNSYIMEYTSAWIDFGSEANPRAASIVKIPKKIIVTFISGAEYYVTVKWALDYSTSKKTVSGFINTPAAAQYAISEYSIAEYSGGIALAENIFALGGAGRILQMGFSVNINGGALSLQKVELAAKVGRSI